MDRSRKAARGRYRKAGRAAFGPTEKRTRRAECLWPFGLYGLQIRMPIRRARRRRGTSAVARRAPRSAASARYKLS